MRSIRTRFYTTLRRAEAEHMNNTSILLLPMFGNQPSIIGHQTLQKSYKQLILWWVVRGSNSRHLRCKRSALPTELTTRWTPLTKTMHGTQGGGITLAKNSTIFFCADRSQPTICRQLKRDSSLQWQRYGAVYACHGRLRVPTGWRSASFDRKCPVADWHTSPNA